MSNNNHTYSNPGVIEISGTGPPVLENWRNDSQLKLETNKLSFTVSSWNYGTCRANVAVTTGRWYYELSIKTTGQARIGWANSKYAPESNYVGVGSDSDSWAWDGSQTTAYHNEKQSGTNKTFGEYWSNNDIIGCSVDFDLCEIRYYKNGKDLGAAFKIMKMPTLHPCVSFYRGCVMTLNLGPTFKHKPVGFYGLNPTINANQKKNLLNIFIKYHKKGTSLSDSMSRDVIKMKGVQALVDDVGATSPMDPHLLLLAWKLRSKKFCEFMDNEWMVLWANEQAFTIEEIKSTVARWRKEVETNDSSFRSFYNFVFDYLKSEKGTMCTALEKEDAIFAWTLLGFEKKNLNISNNGKLIGQKRRLVLIVMRGLWS